MDRTRHWRTGPDRFADWDVDQPGVVEGIPYGDTPEVQPLKGLHRLSSNSKKQRQRGEENGV